jgi:phosphatidylserine/phosphatidylglycerophosphate/cardiolipin synthase-like enzyme
LHPETVVSGDCDSELISCTLKSPSRITTVISDDWDLQDILIPRTTLTGWLVTNLDPAGKIQFLSHKNFVSILIDAEAAWEELKLAVLGSNNEINLLLFLLDVPRVFISFDQGHPKDGVPTQGSRLEKVLLDANRKSASVAVRFEPRRATIDVPVLREAESTWLSNAKGVKKYFDENQPNTVQVRPYASSVRLPMHAKYVTFDGIETHIIGSPLLQEYFDTQAHKFDEPRRGTFRKPVNGIRVPIHDVGLKIQGPATQHARKTFFVHWKFVGGEVPAEITPPDSSTPNASIQIVRTLPGERFEGLEEGEAGILEAYLRMFEQATDYVYLENQYFVDLIILRAITLTIRKPGNKVQFIILINSSVDLPPYNMFQGRRIPELERDRIPRIQQELAQAGFGNRLGIFCLWGHEETSPRHRIVRNYIHSKVGLADDKWATVGSANLDGVSLHQSEHYIYSPRVPAHWPSEERTLRATEVNAVVLSELDGTPSSPVPKALRMKLWAEHLGDDADVENRPRDGWLTLWQDKAREKLTGLVVKPYKRVKSKILHWNASTNPRDFLRAQGVRTEDVDIRTEVRQFDFETGRWIED